MKNSRSAVMNSASPYIRINSGVNPGVIQLAHRNNARHELFPVGDALLCGAFPTIRAVLASSAHHLVLGGFFSSSHKPP